MHENPLGKEIEVDCGPVKLGSGKERVPGEMTGIGGHWGGRAVWKSSRNPQDSTRVTLAKTPSNMEVWEPKSTILCKQARLAEVGLGHLPSHKTLHPQLLLPARCTRVHGSGQARKGLI